MRGGGTGHFPASLHRGRLRAEDPKVLVRTTELEDGLAVLDAVFSSRRPWLPETVVRLVSGDGRAWPAAMAKLRRECWTEWSREEQVVIRRLLDTVWEARLASYPPVDDDDAATLLVAVAQVLDDVRPFLDMWVGRVDQPGPRHLAAFVREHAVDIATRSRLRGQWWDDRHVQMIQIVSWLLEAHVADALDLAAFSALETSVRDELASAAQRLRSLQPGR